MCIYPGPRPLRQALHNVCIHTRAHFKPVPSSSPCQFKPCTVQGRAQFKAVPSPRPCPVQPRVNRVVSLLQDSEDGGNPEIDTTRFGLTSMQGQLCTSFIRECTQPQHPQHVIHTVYMPTCCIHAYIVYTYILYRIWCIYIVYILHTWWNT